MELKPEYYDQIEDYVNGKLQGPSLEEFKSALANFPELQAAVDQFPLAKKIAAALIEDETRQFIQQLGIKKKSPPSKKIYIAIAASIAVIIMTWNFYHVYQSNELLNNKSQMFADLYIRPAEKGVRGDPNTANRMDVAIQLFDIENTEGAFQIFQSMDPMGPDSVVVSRYLAHCALLLNNYPYATKWFTRLSQTGNSLYADEACYHLMLINLLQKNTSEAKKWYKAIKDKTLIAENKRKLIKKIL